VLRQGGGERGGFGEGAAGGGAFVGQVGEEPSGGEGGDAASHRSIQVRMLTSSVTRFGPWAAMIVWAVCRA